MILTLGWMGAANGNSLPAYPQTTRRSARFVLARRPRAMLYSFYL
ncbi:MAG TPA: hypothetical protein VGH37_15980 [Candidatus Acidoferrum sp.]|jgi:hypothetical protein